jgi:two-component system CheB/CheR fusion protein
MVTGRRKTPAIASEQPLAEHDRQAQPVDDEERPRLAFPVVAIGASAGGLEPAMDLFEKMPARSGMAFVLIQHLRPDRETMLPEIVGKKTNMPVRLAEDGIDVEADHVYVIRPGRTLTIRHGKLHLGEPVARPMRSRPIDDFFKSLAEEQRERAVAIILSGMGSNGTAGAQAIKAVGGLCIAQEPETAAFPSMPQHLIDAGYADYVLRPGDIPEVLLAYAGHPYARDRGDEAVSTALQREQQQLREIMAILRTRTRHDFGGYKKPTVLRRIQRRMGLSRVTRLGDYARILRQTPSEVTALADDLLIHVTGFFRDPAAWVTLHERAIVPLVTAREPGSSIRAWVAACSSGEEAYSLGMLLIEECERQDKRLDIKIFATDTAERTLHNARQGIYPGGIEAEIPPDRLERFFQREDAIYRVRPELREIVVFAPQNVLRDPPFSRLDIVTCRNMLIYLEPEMQQRVLAMLHFGLRDGGVLFLGTSEMASGGEALFETVDKKARIFRRVRGSRARDLHFPIPGVTAPSADQPAAERNPQSPRATVQQITARALLHRHVPAAVAVDRDLRILYFHGDTSPFLSQPAGEPTRDLMEVVAHAIRAAVREAVRRAVEPGANAGMDSAMVERPGGARDLVLVKASTVTGSDDGEHLVISFTAVPVPAAEAVGEARANSESVRSMRDDLQDLVEELQTSNEELKAAHEEVVSTNEELQSTNEELETSREEMQSLNEELSTVNSQLQAKVEEYQAVSNDLASLLTSTDLAVLFLDTRFCIRRFTTQARDLVDVIETDIGRPLSDLALKFDDPNLFADAKLVLERLAPSEREVRGEEGRWYFRRITPYRSAENRIDGVVIAFLETTARRTAEEALRASEEQFRRAIEEAPIPVILLADDGEIVQMSKAWTAVTGYTLRDTPALENWLPFVQPEGAAELRRQMRALFDSADATIGLELSVKTLAGEWRYWKFNAAAPGALRDGRRMCVAMAVDITDRKLAESELLASRDAVEAASAMKDQFLANISHELRTPLSVILIWAKLLAAGGMSESEQNDAVTAVLRSADAQRRLIEDLLDTTRIASGKLSVTLKPVVLSDVLRAAVDTLRPVAEARNLTVEIAGARLPDHVLGDPVRLEQIVWILIHNAIKFSNAGARIRIELGREDSSVVLKVRDFGEGISPDFAPQLFQPFTQAGAASGRGLTGLGLGLSIAKSLVQLHGGTIAASSDGPGAGSEFTVRMPAHESPDESLEATVASAAYEKSLSGVTALVVEDNEDALRALTTTLARAGAVVTQCANGAVALEEFARVRPRLIVSDISMPELDGLALLEKIRALEQKRKLAPARAIAVTAKTAQRDRDAARASGFDRFVSKPVDPDTLVATARKLLDAENN